MAIYQSTFSRIYDSVKGAWLETGQFTVTPGVISNATSPQVTVDTSPTCNTGDQIFVSMDMTAGDNHVGELVVGAAVTDTNTVKVQLYNISGSNITDSSQLIFDYLLVHKS